MLKGDNINSLVLAYIGDAYYELLVRNHLINKGIANVNSLQSEAIKFSSAKSQCEILTNLNQYLTEEELDVVKRARNYKKSTHPKNTDLMTYKHSTAFEALIGYLYLNENIDRITDLFDKITTNKELYK